MKFGESLAAFLMEALDTMFGGGGCSMEDLTIGDTILEFSGKIWGYFAIVGLGLTMIYFLFEMNQKIALEGRDLNIKSFMSPFLKFAIAVVLLSQGTKIVGSIIGFHNYTVKKADQMQTIALSESDFIALNGAGGSEDAGTPSEPGSSITDEQARAIVKEKISDMGLWEALAIFPFVLIMYLVELVLSLVWKYKALTYKLEFLWKIGITPVALSDIYNGSHSNAVRWIKGLIATAIYGASFILIVKLGSWVSYGSYVDMVNEVFNDSFSFSAFISQIGYLLSFVIIPFAELGVLSAIKQATKEALS